MPLDIYSQALFSYAKDTRRSIGEQIQMLTIQLDHRDAQGWYDAIGYIESRRLWANLDVVDKLLSKLLKAGVV